MITQDREPINKDARRALSKGQNRVETVEQALEIFAEKMKSQDFITYLRQAINTGNVVKYQMTIKKRQVKSGFIVSLDCVIGLTKKSIGSFYDLL